MTAPKKEKVVSAKGDEAEEMVSSPSPPALLQLLPLDLTLSPRSPLSLSSQVLNYLVQQNRPYGASELIPLYAHPQLAHSPLCCSTADLSANLKNRVSKAQAQKALASLHEKGEIMGKTYGKSTVYCALQVSRWCVSRRGGMGRSSATG